MIRDKFSTREIWVQIQSTLSCGNSLDDPKLRITYLTWKKGRTQLSSLELIEARENVNQTHKYINKFNKGEKFKKTAQV